MLCRKPVKDNIRYISELTSKTNRHEDRPLADAYHLDSEPQHQVGSLLSTLDLPSANILPFSGDWLDVDV